MLRDGAPPPTFRKPPPPAVPMPISHFLVRPRRRAAEKTNAAIDASVRELAGVSRLGIVKKKCQHGTHNGTRPRVREE